MSNGINIYVSNVARDTSEDQLRDIFAQFGQVNSVKIIKDKFTGEVRGFAFVEMANAAEGQAAITGVNGQELNKQQLRVNEARPREDRGFEARGPRKPFNANRGPRY